MRRSTTMAVVVVTVLLGAAVARAQTYAPETLARNFRIDWEVAHRARGPAIEGYVYNLAMRDVDRMRLRIDALDAAGGVTASTVVWVLGTVPTGNRAFFRAPVPPAAAYRVTIVAFDWIIGSGAGGM